MNKKKLALFLILLALVFYPASGENQSAQTIKIMSFNIQTFGVTKMSRPEVVEILVGLVSQADIIAIQEVRSIRIDPVQRFMALLPKKYGYVIGPRQTSLPFRKYAASASTRYSGSWLCCLKNTVT